MSEQLLREALERIADQAQPVPGLAEQAMRRATRRRAARLTAIAAAAVVVVGGSGAAVSVLGFAGAPARPAAQGKPGPLKPIAPGKPVAVEKLWPQAVRTVPGELPDGRPYSPVDQLDDNRLLVRTESGFERTDQLLTYDLTTRQVARVTRVPVPAGSTMFASDFEVGDGHVAWWNSFRRGGRSIIEIWAAPLSGGDARRIAALDGKSDVHRLIIGDGKVFWSLEDRNSTSTGVYEAALSGGAARQIPGTTGFQVLAWPWIGGPGDDWPSTGEGKPGETFHRTLRDLRNGRTTQARLAAIQGPWDCGITWCLGHKTLPKQWSGGNSPVPETYLQRRDGTGGRAFRDLEGRPGGSRQGGLLLNDRFLPYTVEESSKAVSWRLYDTQTGEVGQVSVQRGKHGGYSAIGPRRDPVERTLWIPRENGYMLIDLTKIG
ncbi:hypothetical protein ACFY4C_37515 [Actinomadura viridis]|uniref:hypothetical protein n=1 Tax=Actinomadura viridis TaxID=58110 RepID=UPI0036C962F4